MSESCYLNTYVEQWTVGLCGICDVCVTRQLCRSTPKSTITPLSNYPWQLCSGICQLLTGVSLVVLHLIPEGFSCSKFKAPR